MDNNTPKAFVLYHSYWPLIKDLSNEQLGLLLRAIYNHHMGDGEVRLDPVTDMAYRFIRSQMDRDTLKYENKRASCSLAGKASGLKRRASRGQRNERPLNSLNEDERNERPLNSLNEDERNERPLNSLNEDERNERPLNSLNEDERNEPRNREDNTIDVDVDADADADADGNGPRQDYVEGCSPDINNTDFILYYEILYFRNICSPLEETRKFIAYYTENQWTLERGSKLDTLSKRVGRARKWLPNGKTEYTKRVDPRFLKMWSKIYEKAKKLSVAPNILKLMLDENIRIEKDTRNSYGTHHIIVKPALSEYLNNASEYTDIYAGYIKEAGIQEVYVTSINHRKE